MQHMPVTLPLFLPRVASFHFHAAKLYLAEISFASFTQMQYSDLNRDYRHSRRADCLHTAMPAYGCIWVSPFPPHIQVFTQQGKKKKKSTLSNHYCKKVTTNRKKSKMLEVYEMTMANQITLCRRLSSN